MLNKNTDPIINPIVSYPYRKLFETSFYRMHKYWSRKPPNVVAKYIERYCPIGGVVLDPFLGSGTTAFEAIRTSRKVIGIDVNPLAVFISKTTLSPVRLVPLEDAFYKVVNEVSEKTSKIYKTICQKCKDPASVSFLVHKTDTGVNFELEKPVKVIYQCKCSRSHLYKDPDKLDIKLNNESKRLAITKWYPKNLKLPTIRSGKGEAKTIYDLYTNRNLYLLSEIHAAIMRNSTGMVRDCLLLAFSSSLPQSSRLSGVDKRRKNKIDAMGWILPSYRIMREHVEKNPLEVFKFAFNRVLNGKVESNSIFTEYIEGQSVEDVFDNNATAYITRGSVNDLAKLLGDSRVDYVFTDPPHGHSIQYLKLSMLSNAWLKLNTDEATVVEQSSQTKDAEQAYLSRLKEAFHSIRKILHSDANMHVYQRGKTKDWMSSSATIVSGGFKLKNSIFQPQRYSFRTTYRGRSGVAPSISPPGDWLLHFEPEVDKPSEGINYQHVEDKIVRGIKEIILFRGQPTRTKYLLVNLANKIPSKVYKDRPNIIIEVLNKYRGITFDKVTGDAKKESEEIWFLTDHVGEGRSLDERVERAIIEALIGREEIGASPLFIYQGIYSRFPSILTPDQATIEKALAKVAEVKKVGTDKRLFLKDEYIEKKERQIELTFILLKIGIEEDFDVYVRPSELERIKTSDLNNKLKGLIQKYPNRLISEEFFDIKDSEIKESNVLWIKNDYVHAHFEIKYKLDMPEKTIKRGKIIRKRWPESERVIVIPNKKKRMLHDTLFRKNSFWHVAPFHSILYSGDPETYLPFEATEERYPAKAIPLKLKIVDKQDIVDSKGNIVSFRIMLKCPKDVLRRVRPGHFLKLGINNINKGKLSKYREGNDYLVVKGSPNSDHRNLEFFRIPISIHSVHYENFKPSAFKNRSINFLPGKFWEWLEPGEMKYLDLLIRIAGNGTKTLYEVKKGSTIDAMGPLGKAIKFPPELETAILVSGGVGLASLYPIAYDLRERGRNVKLFAGAYDKRTLMDKNGNLLPDFQEMGVECYATDEIEDKKLVTDLFLNWLRKSTNQIQNDKSRIYACGPWAMLRSVHEVASKYNVPCTVLADKLMLCGIGACMTCVVKTKNKISGKIEMVRSCLDGPAFESTDIVWD